MKKLVIASLSLIILFNAHAQYDPEALAVLDAMSNKYRKMTSFKAEWYETLYNKSAGMNEKTSLRTAVVKGKKFVLNLPDLGQVMYYNGDELHRFSPEANEVFIVEDYDPEEEYDIRIDQVYDLYKEDFKYNLENLASFSDPTVRELAQAESSDYIIKLTPEKRDLSYFLIRMVISSSYDIKSLVIYSDSGNRNIYNIKSYKRIDVEDSYFSFDFKNNPNVEVLR
ncbi:LolA family protein [Ekhidna sp.]|uniref:LolA family protein n=1 Tax=Ekhidna sp. TaxID=2608089 RepID=UPI003C79A4C4